LAGWALHPLVPQELLLGSVMTAGKHTAGHWTIADAHHGGQCELVAIYMNLSIATHLI